MGDYSTKSQFIDLAAQQKTIRPDLEMAIGRVLDHGQYIMGPEVAEFEAQLKEFTGVRHAVSCGNGTDALMLVLMAWGVGPGDAVFVPSFSYVASAEAPAQLGATPFFVDVCKSTFNMDPQSFKQAVLDCRKLGLRPAVVMPVDLFGSPSATGSIREIAGFEAIKVLVDGAQSFGSMHRGQRFGTLGDATTTSFFPAKPLGCYGDGGAVFTNNEELARTVRSLSLHGRGTNKYDNIAVGVNSRLDTIQAAILIEKLKIFPEEVIRRNKVAEQYTEVLSKYVVTPRVSSDDTSVWAQYTIQLENRDEVEKKLKKIGVPTNVYYPIPLSSQTGYKHFPRVKSGCTISKHLSKTVLSLPMHGYMENEKVEKICKGLRTVL